MVIGSPMIVFISFLISKKTSAGAGWRLIGSLAPGRGTFHTQLCRSAPTWARVHVNNNNIHPLTPQGLCFYKQLHRRGAQNWIHGTPKVIHQHKMFQNQNEGKLKAKGFFIKLKMLSQCQRCQSLAQVHRPHRHHGQDPVWGCNYNSGPEAKLQRQNTNFPVTRHTSHRVTTWRHVAQGWHNYLDATLFNIALSQLTTGPSY